MAGLENDGSSKQTMGNNVSEEANICYEDEINLIDYFLVLWKRKWFIFLASVLPALIVGLAIFLWPRDHKISYTYNMELGEKTFKILEDRFYSTENLEKLIGKLQEDGFERYAKNLAEDLDKFVSFEISPSYFEVIKPSEAKNFEELQKIQQVKGTLLAMRVGAKSEENIRGIALVCRKNFEQIIPMYSEKEQLNSKIISLKGQMAGIEEARYTLNLQLERKKTTLEKLKNSGSEGLDKLPSDIILQFNDVGGNSAFLPLSYQIQAAETQIINLQEKIRSNKEMYEYYAGLLKLNGALLSHVEKLIPSYYTLGQFHVFLTNTLAEYKEDQQQLQDYLKAYIKRLENKIASVIPLVEKPKVYPVAKGTVKESAIVFVIALVISVFASFLSASLKKSQAQAS